MMHFLDWQPMCLSTKRRTRVCPQQDQDRNQILKAASLPFLERLCCLPLSVDTCRSVEKELLKLQGVVGLDLSGTQALCLSSANGSLQIVQGMVSADENIAIAPCRKMNGIANPKVASVTQVHGITASEDARQMCHPKAGNHKHSWNSKNQNQMSELPASVGMSITHTS